MFVNEQHVVTGADSAPCLQSAPTARDQHYQSARRGGELSDHAVQQPQDGFEHERVLQGEFNETFKNEVILLL